MVADPNLMRILKELYQSEKPKSIGSFIENGSCLYAEQFRDESYQVECYNRNEIIEADKKFDWVQGFGLFSENATSPQGYEDIVNLLTRHSNYGIIVSCPHTCRIF